MKSDLYVLCPSCGEKHYNDELHATGLEEDIEGRDVIRYVCPVTKTGAQAVVRVDTTGVRAWG